MKVLIITYYWPPAGGPGVQRWLKFVKYLGGFGIDPILYIPENPTYPLLDPTLVEEVTTGITMLRQPIFEPYRFAQFFSRNDAKTISKGIIAEEERQSFLQKVLLYIRGNFFIPDARKFWVTPSVTYLKKYIDTHTIDCIVTTGPPHSVHLIGQKLRQETNIPWLADFRDPWTTIGYQSKLKLSKFSQKKHKKLEKEVLHQADHIVVTSYTTKKEFQAITESDISVITNGYDTEKVAPVVLDTRFTISHIGSLLSGRNPKNLWEVLYELTQQYTDFADAFCLQLVGAVSEDVLASIQQAGLSDFLEIKGYVPHAEAIRIQRSAQVLALIEIDSKDTRCIIPGKLFEYMISGRPILAMGPEGADVSRILSETNSGTFFEYHEKDALKKQILMYFESFKKGALSSQVQGIEKYSRRELTGRLAAILKTL